MFTTEMFRYKVRSILVLTALVAVFLTLSGRLLLQQRGNCPSRQFVSSEWKLPTGISGVGVRNFTKRSSMIDDLTENHLTTNLHRSAVLSLLGQPSQDLGSILVYYVGPERSWMSIDSETLFVEFDLRGGLRSAHTRVD
jgi:hypothetical protein